MTEVARLRSSAASWMDAGTAVSDLESGSSADSLGDGAVAVVAGDLGMWGWGGGGLVDDEGAAAEGTYFEAAGAAETWGVMEKERCLGIGGGIGVRDFVVYCDVISILG